MDLKQIFLAIVLGFSLIVQALACPQIISNLCECVDQTDGILLSCVETEADQLLQTLKHSQAELGLIKWLILNRTSIPHLPSNYFNGLYIRRLDLVQNGMQSLDAEAFAGLGSTLQELHIQKNNLTRIPVSALSKLNSLLRLDLSENNFHSLEELDALPPLTKVSFHLKNDNINSFSCMTSIWLETK